MLKMIKLSGTNEEVVEKGLIEIFYSQLKSAMKESDFELVYDWDNNEFFGIPKSSNHNYTCVLKSLMAYLSDDFKIDYDKFNSDFYQQRYINKMA